MADMLTLEAFEEASAKVKEVTQETKLIESPSLSAQCGNRVWLKPENMQRTGAYKLRGAYYKISKLSQEELDRGVITASAGNHAQGVAYAASHAGARSVVVMPTTTPLIKVERTKGYGAEVVLFGDVFDEAQAHAIELSEREGLTYIPPFNDETIATGQGTIAMEIILIGLVARSVNARRVTIVQVLMASLLSFGTMPLVGESVPPPSWLVLGSAFALGVSTAGIQYAINWAQKKVSPTRATLI